MTRRGRVQAIERIHYFRDRGIETERHRRRLDVVVDRFRNADAIDARFLHLHCRRHRTITADDDEGFNIELVQNFFRARDHFACNNCAIARADFGDEMAAIGCADYCSAKRHDSFGAFAIEHDVITGRQQSFEAVAEADYFPTKFFTSEDDAAQNCVQPGAIPAAGQNAYSCLHAKTLIKAFFWDRQACRRLPIDRRAASPG